LVQARKGQGLFRERLDAYWSERCALAEINRRELLRASHIKPWASSNHAERLDTFNGLLLSVTYDAAFDALLLTFDHNPSSVVSDFTSHFSNCAKDTIAAKADAVGLYTQNEHGDWRRCDPGDVLK
jgi:predicted restriction endonuclease